MSADRLDEVGRLAVVTAMAVEMFACGAAMAGCVVAVLPLWAVRWGWQRLRARQP